MRRFVVLFLLSVVALLVLYEAIQHLRPARDETWERTWEEAALMTGATYDRLGEALARAPAPQDARDLEALLGVSVVPITEATYQHERSQAALLTRQDGIELAVLIDGAEHWRVVAALPMGPVSLDAVTLYQTDDAWVGPSDLLSVLVLLLGVVGLGVGLIWSPARQLRELASTARALRDGHLDARAEVPAGGLVAPVARALNDMAEQIQQVVDWQELVLQTVAHELRTPLSRVRFIVERVADAEDRVERDEAMQTLDGELTELEDLLSSVLAMVRADQDATTRQEPVDLGEVIEAAVGTLARRLQDRESPPRIEQVGLQRLPLARVERAAAARVFDNLLGNAAAHAHQRVRVVAALEGDSLVIAVEDDGDGVPEEQRSRIFEPFVRLDAGETRMGTGLGLTIVQRIVEAHGRPVSVARSELGGLRVETRWPLTGE